MRMMYLGYNKMKKKKMFEERYKDCETTTRIHFIFFELHVISFESMVLIISTSIIEMLRRQWTHLVVDSEQGPSAVGR